jgi:uncharacterized protein (DUF1697 family)
VRLIAFLRGAGGGGRTVTMEYLRTVFDAEGFADVETFQESGNVVFEGDEEDTAGLERVIEEMLLDALGYTVTTFIRTDVEVRAIAKYAPFMPATIKNAPALNVAFFKHGLDDKQTRAIVGLKTDVDEFHVRGREAYWLWRTRLRESKVSSALIEIAAGRPVALRNMNLVKEMAKRYGPRAFEKE